MIRAKYNKIAYCVVAHLVDTGHIVEYFREHAHDFFLFIHPPSFKNQETVFRHYQYGLLVSEEKMFAYKGNSKVLIYVFIFLYYWRFLCRFKLRRTHIVVTHPIFLLFHSVQRMAWQNRLVLWLWDYFPSSSRLLRFYNWILDGYVKHVDHVIFLTDAIGCKYDSLRNDDQSRTISFGLAKRDVLRAPVKNHLGFIGIIKEGQGLDMMLELVAHDPNLKLDVVGDGPVRGKLVKAAEERGVSERITFFGYQHDDSVLRISAGWLAGLALYEESIVTNISFADPSKVKLYLELGVPVIMTNVTYLADSIGREHAGVCVGASVSEILRAVEQISRNYSLYQEGIAKLVERLEFGSKYDHDFQFLQTDACSSRFCHTIRSIGATPGKYRNNQGIRYSYPYAFTMSNP